MKKLLLSVVALLGVASLANAQFRMDKDYPTAGIKVKTDTLAATRTFLSDFNTDKVVTLPGGAKSTAQNQRGIQMKVYNELGANVSGVDGKSENYGSNGNLLHIANVDSVIKFYTSTTSPAWSANHNFWKPAACFFDASTTDQVLSMYPGIYKKQDYRLQINFQGYKVVSDIEFDLATFSIGNTGKTAKYKLWVSFDSDKTSFPTGTTVSEYSIADFYTTGITAGNQTHVKLASVLGIDSALFSNRKVYISLTTEGSGDYIQPFKYDPVISIDNLKATFALTNWIQPATGIITNTGTTPYKNDTISNTKTDSLLYFPVILKTANRVGTFTITSDIADAIHSTKKFHFLSTAGVKANDGNGNYTVDVPYTYYKDSLNASFVWTKESILIPAPAAQTSVNDDILVWMTCPKGTLTEGQLLSEQLELNSGTRIFYQFNGKVVLNPLSAPALKSASMQVYSNSGKIFAVNATGNVSVINLSGVTLKTVSAEIANSGIAMEPGAYIVNANGESTKVFVD